MTFFFKNLHFFTPFAHHVRLRMDVEGLEVVRSYTPVLESLDPMLADDGRMHILVKTYQDGAMTPPLKRLDVGTYACFLFVDVIEKAREKHNDVGVK